MSEQALLAAIALAIPAGFMLAVLVIGRRDRFQFSLTTILFCLIPFAAMIAWIATWEGPFLSGRRVLTHKTAMLAMLLNVGAVFVIWHRGWFPSRVALVTVILLSLLFGWFAWKRHQELYPAEMPGSQAINSQP